MLRRDRFVPRAGRVTPGVLVALTVAVTVMVAFAVAPLGTAKVRAHGASRAPGFAYGVAAGEVTPTSAVLWARAPRPGPLALAVSRTRGLSKARVVARAEAGDDLTVSVRVRGLVPGARYRYRFTQGSAMSETGTFVTAPPATSTGIVRFGLSGDADATPGPNGRPGFNRFQVYGRMADERNDFNVNLGDTIYSDSELAGSKPALTVQAKWEKYRLGLALPSLRRLRSSASLYSQWDDHEFVNDFTRPENGDALYRAGRKAFMDYAPVTYSSKLGLYRTYRWGRNLELFFLDERSFRSAKADDACKNDLAPTAPQSVRNAFASLAPSLASPPPAGCLATIDDPGRTMLGAGQYAAFTRAIKASTATFKVIVNEVPIQQFYALPYDRWEGYEYERLRLLRFLQANVRNVVFLTTDAHGNLVNEVRYRTLGGTPEGTGIWEAVTGPVATNTFSKEIDRYLGSPGAGSFIGSLFFKPPPPRGVGMRCAALDVYSYAEVAVTSRKLTISLRGAQGRPVQEATDTPCAPLVVTAR